MFNKFHLTVLVLLLIVALPTGLALAQGEVDPELPKTIVEFFSPEGLATTIAAVTAVIMLLLGKAGVETRMIQIIVAIVQAVLSAVIVLVGNFVPAEILAQYQWVYAIIIFAIGTVVNVLATWAGSALWSGAAWADAKAHEARARVIANPSDFRQLR